MSELKGAALDAAVAEIEGVTGLVEKDGRMCHVREWDPEGRAWRDSLKEWVMWVDYAPSQRWDHGGPLIEKHGVWLSRSPLAGTWGADIPGEPGDPLINPEPKRGEPGHVKGTGWGETPLIAAMRAIVDAARS